MATMGYRLRWARERRLWNPPELAECSGVPVVTISRIENDWHWVRPRFATLRKLADALHIEPRWLAYGEGSPEPASPSA